MHFLKTDGQYDEVDTQLLQMSTSECWTRCKPLGGASFSIRSRKWKPPTHVLAAIGRPQPVFKDCNMCYLCGVSLSKKGQRFGCRPSYFLTGIVELPVSQSVVPPAYLQLAFAMRVHNSLHAPICFFRGRN
jgi:hypothetical protein